MVRRWFAHYYESGQHQFSDEKGTRISREVWALRSAGGGRFFDEILTYRKKHLGEEFILQQAAHFKHSRGAGYWVWKPRVVQLLLEKMAEGDELLYLDSGCEVIGDLTAGFDLLARQDIVPFYQPYCEKQWTKMDLVVRMGATQEHLNDIQPWAGGILLKKTAASVKLVNEWVELACDLHLIDDSPSILPNDPCFQEHRHDQSIWSLLVKRDGYQIRQVPRGIMISRLTS